MFDIERVKSDFYVSESTNLKVTRQQFPIILAYSMTVHKSQGLTLERAIVDCGRDIFSKGQIYVALNRVTSSDRLILFNYSASRIKACNVAISEYTRLRSQVGLAPWFVGTRTRSINDKCDPVVPVGRKFDVIGTVPYSFEASRTSGSRSLVGGFRNETGTSCYSNALLQCLLHLLHPSSLNIGLFRNTSVRHKKCENQSLQNL